MLPTSRTFSAPGGMFGCEGNGRMRVWMVFGWVDRSGFRIGRFLGVTMMVMVRFWRAKWWERSRSASMWPCAGYGNTRM